MSDTPEHPIVPPLTGPRSPAGLWPPAPGQPVPYKESGGYWGGGIGRPLEGASLNSKYKSTDWRMAQLDTAIRCALVILNDVTSDYIARKAVKAMLEIGLET